MNEKFIENYVNSLLNMPFASVKKELKKIGFEWVANDVAYDYEGVRARQVEFCDEAHVFSVVLIVKVGGTRDVIDIFEIVNVQKWLAALKALIEKKEMEEA